MRLSCSRHGGGATNPAFSCRNRRQEGDNRTPVSNPRRHTSLPPCPFLNVGIVPTKSLAANNSVTMTLPFKNACLDLPLDNLLHRLPGTMPAIIFDPIHRPGQLIRFALLSVNRHHGTDESIQEILLTSRVLLLRIRRDRELRRPPNNRPCPWEAGSGFRRD